MSCYRCATAERLATTLPRDWGSSFIALLLEFPSFKTKMGKKSCSICSLSLFDNNPTGFWKKTIGQHWQRCLKLTFASLLTLPVASCSGCDWPLFCLLPLYPRRTVTHSLMLRLKWSHSNLIISAIKLHCKVR